LEAPTLLFRGFSGGLRGSHLVKVEDEVELAYIPKVLMEEEVASQRKAL
jgi:hypothetical protein